MTLHLSYTRIGRRYLISSLHLLPASFALRDLPRFSLEFFLSQKDIAGTKLRRVR